MTPAIRRSRSSTSPPALLSTHATYPPVHRCTLPALPAHPPWSTTLLPLPARPIAPERRPPLRPSARSPCSSATPPSVYSPPLPAISVAMLLHYASFRPSHNRRWPARLLHT